MEINIHKEKVFICLIEKKKYSKFVQERFWYKCKMTHTIPIVSYLLAERISNPSFFLYYRISERCEQTLGSFWHLFPLKCWSQLQGEPLEDHRPFPLQRREWAMGTDHRNFKISIQRAFRLKERWLTTRFLECWDDWTFVKRSIFDWLLHKK